jgi:ferredoxin-NADP reductase
MLRADAAAGAGSCTFRPTRIAALTRETTSVLELDLEPADGSALCLPLPGQYVSVRFKPSPNAPPVVRCFSLCGPPTTARYRLGVKSNPSGTASRALVDASRVGDSLDVSTPQGSFVLKPGDGPIALVSAGIGITPVLAMLYALKSEHTQREVWWFYGARNRAQHPFANDVNALLAASPSVHPHTRYSRPGPGDVLGRGYDSVGRVDAALIERCGVPAEAEFYVCGPAGLLDDVRAGLGFWGVDPNRIHSEVFASPSDATTGRVTASPDAPLATPLVSFARSGRAFQWNAADRTLLDLAERCDVSVPWLCRLGMCHTCETTLLSGSVRYHPMPMDPPSRGNVLLCCAQPDGDIVLDR